MQGPLNYLKKKQNLFNLKIKNTRLSFINLVKIWIKSENIMVVIRLARFGSTHKPKYRVTVADQRFSATGRFLEIVGHYDPFAKKDGLTLKMDRMQEWISKGAQASQRVKNLMTKYSAK